jgi:hypothetical protein
VDVVSIGIDHNIQLFESKNHAKRKKGGRNRSDGDKAAFDARELFHHEKTTKESLAKF